MMGLGFIAVVHLNLQRKNCSKIFLSHIYLAAYFARSIDEVPLN